MRTFYFLRHGQTDWNAAGRLQGHSDIPLNATGIAQALRAADHYSQHPVDRIISSPLQRAHVTAQAVADRLRVPLETDERLKERHSGPLDGMTKAEIEAGDPLHLYDPTLTNDWYPDRPAPRGGESREAVADRAEAAVREHMAKHPHETLLFVAHGAWFRALAHRLASEGIYSDNATPYVFEAPAQPDAPWLVKTGIEETK